MDFFFRKTSIPLKLEISVVGKHHLVDKNRGNHMLKSISKLCFGTFGLGALAILYGCFSLVFLHFCCLVWGRHTGIPKPCDFPKKVASLFGPDNNSQKTRQFTAS